MGSFDSPQMLRTKNASLENMHLSLSDIARPVFFLMMARVVSIGLLTFLTGSSHYLDRVGTL
jgi:hypothetical protein